MPVLPEIKFYKYVINLDDRKGLPPDKLLKELKEHADKLQLKGIKMKILADDFMSARNNISCNGITNDAITPYHNHDFYEMNYVVKGECVQYIEGKSLIMKEHDLLLLPPEAFHAPCPVGDSKCINILFRAEWIKTLEEKFSKYDKNSFLSFLIKNNVYMLFGNISEGPASESPGLLVQNLRRPSRFDAFDDVYAESTAVKLFVELSKCKRNDTHFSVRSHNVGADNPEIIFQYIRDNISSVTLEGASAHFGYTGAHLSRLIKKIHRQQLCHVFKNPAYNEG